MRLFRKNLSEKDAAVAFVDFVLKSVEQQWTSISQNLERHSGQSLTENQDAQFELALAALAIQIQALPNFLEVDQANRIEGHILEILSPTEIGAYSRDTIREYISVWRQSLQRRMDPMAEIMPLLAKKMGYNPDGGLILLMNLEIGHYIAILCCFKELFEDYKLTG